jgi:hypothetical protein
MKKMPIDKMLCVLERRADLISVEIDTNPDYMFICEILAAVDFGEAVSYEVKEQIYFRLRKLFQYFNLDFGAAVAAILLGE